MTHRHGHGRWPVVLVVLVVGFVVMASPAAASSHLAVASAHTTDTDFTNADTLSNVTVTGSGADARVALNTGAESDRDSFETSGITGYDGATGSFGTTTSIAHHGTTSLEKTGADDHEGIYNASKQFDAASSTETSLWFNYGGGDTRGGLYIADGSGGGYTAYLNGFDAQGSDDLVIARMSDSTTFDSTLVSSGDVDGYDTGWYQLHLTYDDGAMEAWIENDSGTVLSPISTSDATHSVNRTGVWAFDSGFTVDELAYTTGDPPDTGTYISQPHGAENASAAWTNLTLTNASATVTWQANTSGTWSDITTTTHSTTGNHTADIAGVDASGWRVNVTFQNTTGTGTPMASLHDEGVLFDADAPVVDAATASPDDETVDNRDVTLEVNVSDADYRLIQDDTVTVDFLLDGESVGSDTLTENGTASTSTTVGFGSHTWHIVANDTYDGSTTSQTFTFDAPGNMTIYNESAPETPIDGQQVTGTFYELDGDRIFEKTTTDGNLSLEGIGTETFVVQLETSQYADRQVIIKDVTVQQDVWLLNESSPAVDTVSPTFFVDDATGDFDETESRVYILRGLNISGETEYRTIAAEEVGTDGYTETLEMDVRYRLIVENQEGDRRVLGKFGASDSNSYTLTVEELEFSLTAADDAVEWGFNYTTAGDDPQLNQDQVAFRYHDPDGETTGMDVTIYERGNQSNVLHDSTQPGPFGTLSITESIPDAENDSEWVVEWDADRDGTPINGSYTAGPLGAVGIPLDDTLKHVIAVGLILLIGGLASQVNAPTVGVATAGTAGIAYYIQWLPGEVAGGMIVLAFAVPVFYIVNRGGGV